MKIRWFFWFLVVIGFFCWVLGSFLKGSRSLMVNSDLGKTWVQYPPEGLPIDLSVDSAVIHDGKIVMIGSGVSTDLTGVWQKEDERPCVNLTMDPGFKRRYKPALASFDGKLWVVGGTMMDPVIPDLNDVWSSEDGKQWKLANGDAPFGSRTAGSFPIVGFKNKLWLIGGFKKDTNACGDDLWASSDGETWEQVLRSAPFGDRCGAKAVVFKDHLWLIGGGNEKIREQDWLNDVWESEDGKSWERVSADPGFGTDVIDQVTVSDGRLWVFKGERDGPNRRIGRADVWASEDGKNWVLVNQKPEFGLRTSYQVLGLNNELWLFGGMENGRREIRRFSDFWRSI